MVRAFARDFEVNGPSVLRIASTTLDGWKRYRNHPDERIRRRYAHDAQNLATVYSAAAWAARRYFGRQPRIREKLSELLSELHRTLGIKSRLSSMIGGRYVYRNLVREERRLADGWTYEPPTFYETNYGVSDDRPHRAERSRYVVGCPCQ